MQTAKPFGRLNNYIGMYRRRSGLFQCELGTLVGVEHAASIRRYETSEYVPDLQTALALACALGEPVEEIFAGLAEQVRDKVGSRAQALLEAMSDKPTHENSLKLALFARLAHPDDEHTIPWEDAA